MFEEILSHYPKRLDVWSVYADVEVKHGSIEKAIRILERATLCHFSTKKMKFLFKKWLNLENERGNEEGIEKVKQAAREYVEKIQT